MQIKRREIFGMMLCLMMLATVFTVVATVNVGAKPQVTFTTDSDPSIEWYPPIAPPYDPIPIGPIVNVTDPDPIEPLPPVSNRIATSKYTYYIGEPVIIFYDGTIGFSSVTLEKYLSFTIKDASGNYVKEQISLSCYVLWAASSLNGFFIWEWNQTYHVYESHYGDLTSSPPVLPELVPPSGEQVPPGKYFVYISINGVEMGKPAEFEIVDSPYETANNLTVVTNKYSYRIGEPVEIDVTGSAIWSGTGNIGYDIDYEITDEYGNIVRMRFYFDIFGCAFGKFPMDSTPHPIFVWNQTYWIHEKNNPMAPSGEQVPPGKYYVWLYLGYENNIYGPAEFEIVEPAPLEAGVDIDPDTLNLKSRGRWITAYITLPNGHDVNDININTITLEDTIPAAWGEVQEDVLMVKFDRSDVEEIVSLGQITLTVSGELLDGTPFSGSDTIRVINPR